MRVGTKSVLFGAHCFFIHPFFVAEAWRRLYGFPTDIRLWAAFFVHDIGYWGLPNMDGDEGERHPEWGAIRMARWFDKGQTGGDTMMLDVTPEGTWFKAYWCLGTWGQFCLYHSRFYCKRDGKQFSNLCVADKLATALEPWWFYLPRVYLSGELWEYLERAGGTAGSKYGGEPEVGKYAPMNLVSRDESLSTYRKVRHWHARMADYLSKWAYAHKDGGPDTWTPGPTPKAVVPAPDAKGNQ